MRVDASGSTSTSTQKRLSDFQKVSIGVKPYNSYKREGEKSGIVDSQGGQYYYDKEVGAYKYGA